MTGLTPQETQRLNRLYDLLDISYGALRESARIQRCAILGGHLGATLIADINLAGLSKSVGRTWTEIHETLAPKPEPAADAPPIPDPPKEVIQ